MTRPANVPSSTPKKSPAKRGAGKSLPPSHGGKAMIQQRSERRARLDELPTRAISTRMLRVLGLQAGLGSFQSKAKEEMYRVLHNNAQDLLTKAVTQAESQRKRTVTVDMMLRAFKLQHGITMYIGFGDSEKPSRDVHAIAETIVSAGRSKRSKGVSTPPLADLPKKAPESKKGLEPKKSPAKKPSTPKKIVHAPVAADDV